MPLEAVILTNQIQSNEPCDRHSKVGDNDIAPAVSGASVTTSRLVLHTKTNQKRRGTLTALCLATFLVLPHLGALPNY